jgi:uncharacterized membrane protein YqjE
MDINEARVQSPGLLGGITSLAKNLAGLAVSRVELAALELTEVRNHVIELLAYGTATIVALAWDEMGWKILLVMFVVFAVLTAILVMKGLSMLKQGKLAFPETMKELRNDRDMLG